MPSDDPEPQNFAARLTSRLHGYGDDPCMEFEGVWYSGAEVLAVVEGVNALLRSAGVPDTAPVGLVVRNRLPHAAVVLGLLAANRSFSMIYAFQSPASLAADVTGLAPMAVIADRHDWSTDLVEAATALGTVGILIGPGAATYVADLYSLGNGPFAEPPAEVSISVLTSGTTGAPKRVQIRNPVMERGALSASSHMSARSDDPPELVIWPFGGIGGICQLAGALYDGKRMVLLEKFTVDSWASAIKRHGVSRVAVQPTVVRMVLDAAVPPADLASLKFVFGGSAALEPAMQEEFERVYGVPVYWAYGATEFAGTLLSWTPDLHREFGATKRGSVGKPVPGTEVRVVDPATGTAVSAGERGHLEARIPLIGPGWIRTTDLASIDLDGFVTLHGRADGAINRGGFKVLPETVADALRRHPAVLDAVVIGAPDDRLGEVPVAAVELVIGARAPTSQELAAFAREQVPAPQVPVRIQVVDALPRTESLKVDLVEARSLLGGATP